LSVDVYDTHQCGVTFRQQKKLNLERQ